MFEADAIQMQGRQHMTKKKNQKLDRAMLHIAFGVLCDAKGPPLASSKLCPLQDHSLNFWVFTSEVVHTFQRYFREVNLACDSESRERMQELQLFVNFRRVRFAEKCQWDDFSFIYLPERSYSTSDLIIYLAYKNCHYQFSFAQSNDMFPSSWTRMILYALLTRLFYCWH